MKLILLITLFSMICMAFSALPKVEGDVTVKFSEVSDSTEPQKEKGFICEILAGKKNILWQGAENHIIIKLNGISYQEIEVKINSGGSVRKTEINEEYAITLPKDMKEGEIAKITVVKTKNKETLGSSTFKVKYLEPRAVLTNGKSEGTIGSGELRIQTAIIVMFKDVDPKIVKEKCQITQFTMTCFPGYNRADPVSCTNMGSKFDEIALQVLQMPISGDKIVFSEVRGKCPGDSVQRLFNDLTFRIK